MVEGAWGSSEFDRPEEGSIARGVWCWGERRRRREVDPAFLYQLSIIPPVTCCDAGGVDGDERQTEAFRARTRCRTCARF